MTEWLITFLKRVEEKIPGGAYHHCVSCRRVGSPEDGFRNCMVIAIVLNGRTSHVEFEDALVGIDATELADLICENVRRGNLPSDGLAKIQTLAVCGDSGPITVSGVAEA